MIVVQTLTDQDVDRPSPDVTMPSAIGSQTAMSLTTCMAACSSSCWPLDRLRYDGWPSGGTAPTWLKMSSVLSSSQCSTKRPSLTSQIWIERMAKALPVAG